MNQGYTVEHGRPSSEPFLGRDEDGQRVACFRSRYDAELFITMIGCNKCKEGVSDHARVKGYREERVSKRLDHPNF